MDIQWLMEPEYEIQWKVILSTMVQCLMLGLGGYCQAVLNIPVDIVRDFVQTTIFEIYGDSLTPDLSALLWSAILSIPTVGALFGSFVVEYLSERFGRRITLMVCNNLIQITACVLMMLSKPLESVTCLFLGRFISGISLGISSIAPVFLLECAPKDYRGSVAAGYMAGLLCWQITATILGLPLILGTVDLWPFLLGLPALPAIFHLGMAPFFHESPSFLYSRQFSAGPISQSIFFYQGTTAEIGQTMEELEIESSRWSVSDHPDSSLGIWSVLKDPVLRRVLLLVAACNISTSLGAIDLANQYSFEIFVELGIDASSAESFIILAFLPPLFVALIAPFFIEYIGRRAVQIFGVILGILAIVLIFVAKFVSHPSYRNFFALSGLIMSNVGFYGGAGVIPLFIAGELAPPKTRSAISATGIAVNWIPSIMVLMIFPITERKIGSWAYVPFIVCGVLLLTFLWIYLPETKNRNVAEILEGWTRKTEESEKIVFSDPSNKGRSSSILKPIPEISENHSNDGYVDDENNAIEEDTPITAGSVVETKPEKEERDENKHEDEPNEESESKKTEPEVSETEDPEF